MSWISLLGQIFNSTIAAKTVRSLSTGGAGYLTGRKGKYERNTLPRPLVYRLFLHSRAAKPQRISPESSRISKTQILEAGKHLRTKPPGKIDNHFLDCFARSGRGTKALLDEKVDGVGVYATSLSE